jgi:glycosyltransferase involved in cell wall biosynthesis
MRLLQLGKYYDPYMGGIETHLSILCASLRETDEPEVLVCNSGGSTRHDTVRGVSVTRAGVWARLLSTDISPPLVSELSRRRYDIVHLHTPNPMGMVAYLLARKPPKHRLIVTHHSDVVRQAVIRRALEPLFVAVMSRAQVIIATSPNYVATSSELAPYKARVRVVPYGINIEPFADPTHEGTAQELRARFGPRVVLAAGRLIYYKGFEVLLDAMTAVRGHLVIVGEGPLREALVEKARALGIAEQVTFAGEIHQDQMPAWYRAADVFAFPSIARSEAFGIAQLEAMASGLPVVNTALDSGVPFVSVHGETGVTVPPRDAHALASALSELLDDPGRRRVLGSQARERVRAHFTSAGMVDEIKRIYRETMTELPGKDIATAA